MKAHLLYEDQDFNFGADLPPNHEDLIQDLELTTLLQAMALGDKFLFEVSKRVVLASLEDPEAIALSPAGPRRLPRRAGDHSEDVRHRRGRARGQARHLGVRLPEPLARSFPGAVKQLEACVIRLKELRKIADDHARRVPLRRPDDAVSHPAA